MDEKNVYNYHNGQPTTNTDSEKMNGAQETAQATKSFFDRNTARYEMGTDVNSIARSKYNAIIGGLLLYGFIINILMVRFATIPILTMAANNIVLFFVMYIVFIIAGSICMRSKSSVVDFIGYNLVVVPLGLVVTILVAAYTSVSPSIVYYALIVTAGVTIVMMIAGMIMQDFFLSMGRVLAIGLIATIVIQLVVSFVFKTGSTIMDYVVVLLFMGYIGFDWARAQKVQPTMNNAIRSACDLYMDIINIFIRLMSILGRNRK